jgi:hypothetical protein
MLGAGTLLERSQDCKLADSRLRSFSEIDLSKKGLRDLEPIAGMSNLTEERGASPSL